MPIRVGQPVVVGGRSKARITTQRFGGGEFTPAVVSGLIGWYQADSLVLNDDDAVTTWPDSSGQGNDLVATTNGPTFKTAIQNSLPVVRFNGTDDNLLLADTAKFRGTSGFSLFVVGKFTYASTDFIVSTASSTGAQFGYRVYMAGSTGQRVFRAGNTGDGSIRSLTSSDFGAEGAAFDYSTYTWDASAGQNIRRNGASIGSDVDTDAHAAGAQRWALMSEHTLTSFTAGDIAEVIYYEPAISTGDRDLVETYLAAKWGL